jgi:hypothetical protein
MNVCVCVCVCVCALYHILNAQPSFLALAFLWNPLSVLACVGGSSGCIEVTAVLAALCGSALCNPVLAAVGVAWSAYLSPHHALLMVPPSTPFFLTTAILRTVLLSRKHCPLLSNSPPVNTPHTVTPRSYLPSYIFRRHPLTHSHSL